MATYTELHQSEIGQHSQDISSSAILDHGSISFGRFAAESLAWEKWSVFRHNRCQEELEMYKANGLVAQKKAYFEEYYKRVRALKALQSEHRETVQTDACPDVRNSTTQLEHGNSGNDLAKQEKLGPDTVPISDSSTGSVVDKLEEADQEALNDCNGNNDNFKVTDEASNILSTVEPEHSTHEASVSATPPVARSSGVAKHDTHVSDPVKHNANERKKHATVLKARVILLQLETNQSWTAVLLNLQLRHQRSQNHFH